MHAGCALVIFNYWASPFYRFPVHYLAIIILKNDRTQPCVIRFPAQHIHCNWLRFASKD